MKPGGRKFTFFLIYVAAATLLGILGKLTPEVARVLVWGAVGMAGANAVEHYSRASGK